jgi:two-component system, LytTR family, response regulator
MRNIAAIAAPVMVETHVGLKTLIVDDEPVARRIVREELEQLAEVGEIDEAADGAAALASIRESNPDLVFLDLQMPGLGGFDVIRRIEPGPHVPLIVIVTAYDQFAIQAFESGAIDYLLKPVTQDRLAQAVERAVKLRGRPAVATERLAAIQAIAARRIVARSGDEYLLLNAEEVFAFEAEGDLVWIVTARKRYLATQSLKAIQERLGATSFRRIHRKALVNMNHIRKMSKLSSQRWLITLSNGQEFIVSKRQARNVRQLLSW